MAQFTPALTPQHIEFIGRQRMFFVATAPLATAHRINLSPKGIDSFQVLSPGEVAYLDLTGSGNETAAHLKENGRITLMFNSFDEKPLILRIYGTGEAIGPGHARWTDLIPEFTPHMAQRQIICARIDSVQTSCGWGVPRYTFAGERPHFDEWAQKKGPDGLREYRLQKNARSIDGLPTGIVACESV